MNKIIAKELEKRGHSDPEEAASRIEQLTLSSIVFSTIKDTITKLTDVQRSVIDRATQNVIGRVKAFLKKAELSFDLLDVGSTITEVDNAIRNYLSIKPKMEDTIVYNEGLESLETLRNLVASF